MPPARVAALQRKRLRRLLRLAVTRSPFYRDKFRGIDVSRCALSDLPVTTKSELMADFDRAVTDPAVTRRGVEAFLDDPANASRLYLGRYAVSHTSGSQGQPLLIVQDRLGLELLFCFQFTRGNIDYPRSGPAGALHRLFRPARLAVIASKAGFFPSASAWSHPPVLVNWFARVMLVGADDPGLIDKLNTFAPTNLSGYPSALDPLALRADELTRRSALRQVTSYAETLTEAARARMMSAFGVPVLNSYATGECLFLSNGCHTDPGAHVNADWAIAEVVDEVDRPVPPGEMGAKVLITNLANAVQPFVRYEVGDRAVLAAGPCSCGNRLPRLERVEGRTADVFWVRQGGLYRRLSGITFKNAFDYLRDCREWQAVQRDDHRIAFRLELLPGATLDRERARRALDAQLDAAGLLGAVDVELEVVPRLTPDLSTGKVRRVVSSVAPPS